MPRAARKARPPSGSRRRRKARSARGGAVPSANTEVKARARRSGQVEAPCSDLTITPPRCADKQHALKHAPRAARAGDLDHPSYNSAVRRADAGKLGTERPRVTLDWQENNRPTT